MMFNQNKMNLIVLLCLIAVLFFQSIQFRRCDQDQGLATIVTPTLSSPIFIVIPTPTVTPWIKQDILVEIAPGMGLNIWTDNIEADKLRVDGVEGIIDSLIINNSHMISARVDPRYDKTLVAKEILDLLDQPIIPPPTIGKF